MAEAVRDCVKNVGKWGDEFTHVRGDCAVPDLEPLFRI